MSYADSLLAHGEVVALRARQHPLALLIDARRAWLLLIIAIGVWYLGSRLDGNAQTWVTYAGYGLVIVALLWLAAKWWDWRNQEYLVTNRRVIQVEGVVNKRSGDSSLEKINDAVLDQNLLGRIFGYGDLDILTAAEQAIDKFRMLNHALDFKKAMLDQKHELELELGRGPAVIPPAMPPEPGTRPAPAAAMTGGAPSPLVHSEPEPEEHEARNDADDITRTLQELADLRDRGAISPEEFEAKKADLLSRL